MKIIIFQEGLGNQLFEYAFHEYVKKNIDNDVRYVFRDTKAHNGFEITKWFDVKLRKAPWWYRLYIMVADQLMWKKIIKNPYSNQQNYKERPSIIYDGRWVRHDFHLHADIRFKNDLPISTANKETLQMIETSNSVSIHVRRGDYLNPDIVKYFGNICTIEYYKKAVEIIRQKFGDVRFFIFSDDIKWARENLQFLGDSCFVDWNKGNDSIYDIYLMSRCKHNIIANSTFSFWAARLNVNDNTVIYPKKWYNEPWTAPDIFPEEWIGI